MATAIASRREIAGRSSSFATLAVVAAGAGAAGATGLVPANVAAGAARPDGAQPPWASARVPRGPVAPAAPAPAATTASVANNELRPAISRREAIAVAIKELGDAPVIHANGYVCRESFATDDRPQNFYMIGSMGLASAIGLGLALVRPARPCVIFDGDGNLLMSLGTLAMVGSLGPRSFIHVVFDNEVYGSTGGQRSPSREVRLDRLALSAGYRTATAATTPDAIAPALPAARPDAGPHLILVKITTTETPAPRIPHTPRAIPDRFRRGTRVE